VQSATYEHINLSGVELDSSISKVKRKSSNVIYIYPQYSSMVFLQISKANMDKQEKKRINSMSW